MVKKKGSEGASQRLDGGLLEFTLDPKSPKPKNKGGRPTVFDDDVATRINMLIIEGTNLNKICQRDDMPSRDTIYRWLATYPEFSDNYARACKIRREFKYEILEEIPDVEEDVARARLKVDVIKWQLGKEDAKKYGDKVDITSDGKALPTPIFSGLSVVENPDGDIKGDDKTT